jgi:uncharacterized protein YjbI with pentapeptide repeats
VTAYTSKAEAGYAPRVCPPCSLQYIVEVFELFPAYLQSVDFEGADLSNALLVEVEVA